MSVIRKENWKSDIRLAVTLLVGGEAVHVPSHAFTLRFRVCNGQTYYDCWRDDGGVYHNCRPNDDGSMLLCFLDNHKLGLGALHCEYYDYAPDSDFADGNKLTVVPQVLPIELVAGAGDDAEQVDAEVIVAIDGLVGDAQEAIAAATDASVRANEAASRAESATSDAVEAATDALQRAEEARQAASAANAAATRANDAAEAGMDLCERASETATSAANAANVARVNAEMAASVANQAAGRADGAATEAAKAAEHAEAAASLATTAAGKIDVVLDVADGLDNRWSLANYGNVRIVSEGLNDPQRSLRVVFDSLNEITLTERDGSKLSTSVRGGTTYVVPDGSALWMNHRTGELRVGDIAGADDVSLVECSRGLMSGGVFVDLLADYTHHRAASDVAAALEKKANLTSLYRFAGFSIIADGSPEDAAMAFGPYVDVLSSKLDTYCPGWGDVADHRSILQLIRWNNAGSYNSEYLFTGAFGDGLRRAASEAHEMGFNSLVFPNDLVVHEAGVDMLEERIDAVERDKADKSEIVEEIPFVFGEFEHGSGAVYGRYCGSCSLSSIEEGQLIALHLEHNTVAGTNSLRLTLSNGSTHEADIWEYKYDINSRLVPEPVNGSGEYPEGSVLILAYSNGMWMITNPAKRPRLMTTNDWGVPIGRIVSGTFLRDNFYVKSEVDSALSAYATGAEYDSASKRIYLKHGSDRLTGAYVDATAFIKDGMVDNVTISSGYLVITFNTDSGKEPISLAITDIFNASNYYTKADIDNAGYLTSETDPTVPSHVKGITQANITSWSGKQDAIGDLADIRSGASKGATAYQKPSGGIPKSDLASAVQTSLGKADTALQSFTESDPTVPSWAKASSKPTYTAAEVGALPATTSIPTKTSDLTNDSNFVVDADYVHTDSNYTAAEKSKLSGISAGAEANVQSDWSVTETTSDAFIKNKPTIPTESTVSGWGFTKNTGTITGIKMNGASKGTSGVVDLGTVLTSESDPTVPSWAKNSTKPTYNGGEVKYTGTTGNVVTNNTTLNVAIKAIDDAIGNVETLLANI